MTVPGLPWTWSTTTRVKHRSMEIQETFRLYWLQNHFTSLQWSSRWIMRPVEYHLIMMSWYFQKIIGVPVRALFSKRLMTKSMRETTEQIIRLSSFRLARFAVQNHSMTLQMMLKKTSTVHRVVKTQPNRLTNILIWPWLINTTALPPLLKITTRHGSASPWLMEITRPARTMLRIRPEWMWS